jgi:D-sedoheptulose 7-phosphate isomerase
VILAVQEAKRLGCRTISLTGGSGGQLKELAEVSLNASLGGNSSRVQETHIFAIHSVVDLLDRFFLDRVTSSVTEVRET